MKWIIHVTLVFMNLFEANCLFLSLLNNLNMKDPIIIGEINALRTKEMFTLMKNVMHLNQTICLSTSFRNDSLQPSPGIVIQPTKHTSAKFFGQNTFSNVQKPWILVVKELEKYSRIDEPIFFLENKTLWEHYGFKSMKKTNILANQQDDGEFKWNQIYSKNVLERRGNFENIKLITMTEISTTSIQLPRNLDEIANISKEVPNSYEVRILNYRQCGNYPPFNELSQNHYAHQIRKVALNKKSVVKPPSFISNTEINILFQCQNQHCSTVTFEI